MASLTSIDVDLLKVGTVLLKSPTGTNYPANYTLISDGSGGTYWSTIQTAGIPLSFDTFRVDGKSYVASNTGNQLTMTSGVGIGTNTTTSNGFTLFSKSFQTIQAIGDNAIQAFSNIPYPTLYVQGQGGISVTANPNSHILTIQAAPASISTGLYSFYRHRIYENISSISSGLFSNDSAPTVVTASSPSSLMNWVGLGDIVLKGDYDANAVYIGISSFTSEGYSTLQGTAYSAFSRTLSTVSSLFVSQDVYSTSSRIAAAQFSTLSSVVSQNYQQLNTSLSGYATVQQFQYVQGFVNNAFLQISTIPLSPQGAITMGTAGAAYEFSSSAFSLSYLSSPALQNLDIQLTYSPSFLFQTVTSPGLYFISSVLCAKGSLLADTTFVRPWYPTQTGLSNLYTDTITMDFHEDEIQQACATGSTFQIYHRIEGLPGVAGAGVTILTTACNALTIHAHHEILPFPGT